MGSGGGQSTPANTTQSVTQNLPEYVRPYAEQAMERGVGLSNTAYQSYPGQKIAPLTQEHNVGLQGITNRAIQGSPEVNAAKQNLALTQSGAFMQPGANPYLDSAFNRGAEQIRMQVQPSFGHMQAFGGNSSFQEAMGRPLADLATGIYGGNYQAERDRQIKGQALIPQYAAGDYNDAQNLLAVGDIRRTTSQDDLNQQYEEWLRQQNHPYAQLDVLSNAIRGGMAGGGTTTQSSPNPYQPSRAASMLGGGLLGGGIANMAGINPMYGAAGGALLPWIMG